MSLSSIEQTDLEGTTLILPSISLGNLPQLTIDLLIHTYNLDKIGCLDSTYLYPFVSPQDHRADVTETSRPGISHGVEVYYSAANKITVIQQRSPIITNFTEKYVTEVISPFINNKKFAKVYLLDSGDAGLLENHQQIEVLKAEELLSKSLANLNLQNSPETPFSKYTTQVCKNYNVNVIISYIYEGDNFYDAQLQGKKLVDILQLEEKPWVTPRSWLGVYGDKEASNAMEDGLYG
jgi:proteasome chaperone 2